MSFYDEHDIDDGPYLPCLKTAKARLREFLQNMTLDEIIDRLWRQTPSLREPE